MTFGDLIERVHKAGGSIALTERGTIALEAPAPLPDSLVAEIRKHKPTIVAELRRRSAPGAALAGREVVSSVWQRRPCAR